MVSSAFYLVTHSQKQLTSIEMKNTLTWLLFLICLRSWAQVVNAPDLQCVSNDAVNSNVNLSWTNPVNPCGSFNAYRIYASPLPGGPFTLLASITNPAQTSYIHNGALSSSNAWFYFMESDFNCPGIPVLSSDTIDNLRPFVPDIVNVDVVNNQVVFNWKPSVSPETHFYVIYYFIPQSGNALPIDTVYGRFNTSFTDPQADPSAQSWIYTVAAADSCGNIGSFNTAPHQSIKVNYDVSPCDRTVKLNWNNYINYSGGVKEYRVFSSVNGSPFTQAASSDSATRAYNYTGFNDGDSLCFYVVAVNASDTAVQSRSNLICLRASIVQPPAYLNITHLTINARGQVEASWIMDTTAELFYFELQRSNDDFRYDPLQREFVPNPLNFMETRIDSGAMTGEGSYYYKITVVDSCNGSYKSPFGRTIFLEGDLIDYYLTGIQWNSFELDKARVLEYRIYRDYGTGYSLLKTLPPNVLKMEDSLQSFLNEKGRFCYYIEARYTIDIPGIYSDTLLSLSNELCIEHRPIIYIPNAFFPEGVNNLFRPRIIFGDPSAYNMTIFNRWGGKVFETSDPLAGWDGNEKGKACPQGGYGYLISFTAADGAKVNRQGIVTLIR